MTDEYVDDTYSKNGAAIPTNNGLHIRFFIQL